jgi:hypothetical protein
MPTLTTMPCHLCKNPVVQLPVFNGARMTFNAVAIEPQDGDPPQATGEHWYPMRGRGAVPGDMLPERDTIGRAYLTRHRCVPVQDLARHELIEIRNLTGTVKTQHMVLDQLHEYTYRWPSSWAHILRDVQYTALCGERMPGRRSASRERERLRDMPVCPKCMEHLELSKDSRGRAMLQAVRDKTREQMLAAGERVDPATMGKFLRKKHSPEAPAHTPQCPFVRSDVFVPSEWEGFETYPRMTAPCQLCNPVLTLDERLEAAAARHQMGVAASVHAEQDRIRLDAREARRAEATAAFGALGTYVYRPGSRGKKETQLHHHRCGSLIGNDPTGWKGSDSVLPNLEHHYCVTN